LKSNFGSISVLSQEDVLKERAQREEFVAMLIAPTQAAGALNEANNEGATPLMHASMRGLCGVVELLLAAGADVATKDKVDR
jgi:ankyrin repeat protein